MIGHPVNHRVSKHDRERRRAEKRIAKVERKEARRLGFDPNGQFENRIGDVPGEYAGLARTLSRDLKGTTP